MKPKTNRRPQASSRQPQPPDEPQRPPPFRPPPEARPRVNTNATEVQQLHAISVDVAGSAARTRPRASRQPLERSVSKATTRSRPRPKPAEMEALPRQTPLSTNARKLPTTKRAPTPREADHEAGAATEPRAAQTSTHPAGQAKAQRGTATSTVTAEASTEKQLVENAQETSATTATACSNDDGAPARATATTHVETTPPHPKATPTPTTTHPPTAEISTQPAMPDTSPPQVTPVAEVPEFLEGLVLTRQHFIKRSRRTLFFRGRRLALQKLEGDRVLV
ncbi:salivary glue protein Sgs-3-like [Bactrocera dorsalis]|uniref:Salivary glue protein Sgs-3-like n=1 Tax=Bactrocera dorsalis TaxID=27457 RepID=A0ABM3K6H6_BACDO|nr:salivary glue protein Sgs-3-like [Bactrocera dorsalis]